MKIKKLLVAVLSLCLLLSLFAACDASGKSELTEDPGIALTLDNINDYIDIKGSVEAGDTTSCLYDGEWVNLYANLDCSITVSGNTNYEYKDVVIGVKFYHYAPLSNDLVSETTKYINLNLAGNGNVKCVLETPVNQEGWDNISTLTYTFYSYKGISSALGKTSYEIVSVEGTVTKN